MAINNNNGDFLMLEAPPQPPQPAWRVSADAEVIDALAYIDDDYVDPSRGRSLSGGRDAA